MSQPVGRLLLFLGWAGALAGLALPPPAHAIAADAVLAAKADFDRGLHGDDGAAIDRAAEEFQRLVEQDPANPLLRVYYGSAVTLQAKHAWAPWNKMRYAENGLDAIDKSLALLQPEHETAVLAGMPVALVTRIVALTTFVGMPGMFNRLGDAKEVLQQAYKSPSFHDASPHLQASYAYQAALIAQRDGKTDLEVEQLRKVLAASRDAEETPKAAARLKELGRESGR
jgi:tetratricopeptide (TPR) repeat protein